ncbi:NAD(P)H-binding protein [Ideonella azotifigens]|uniref:NmrA-like domain-containing protein n=1 Tax=Ideonella azotifigens TaxID=513160 RepID=A0ABP3VV66_9BURK|nr:NAD(P)H-binding protein [Ideonella azotifigens]MCD2344939.1 NAD(P)H-binding protein [Ideonella azotifigens]
MKQPSSTILAVGAAGKFAGLVLPALAQRGAKVRGLIRRASDTDAVRAHGATDVDVGDLGNRASVETVLEGVDSVFYIAPAALPDEANVGKRKFLDMFLARSGTRSIGRR